MAQARTTPLGGRRRNLSKAISHGFRITVLTATALFTAGCYSTAQRGEGTGRLVCIPFKAGDKFASQHLQGKYSRDRGYVEIERNRDGTELRFQANWGTRANDYHNWNHKLLILTREGQVEIHEQPEHWILDNGPKISLVKKDDGWIVDPRNPEHHLVKIPDGLFGIDVFLHERRLYVFGVSVRSDQYVCFVHEKVGEEFQLVKEIKLPWAGAVQDMDPYSEKVLIWKRGDKFAPLYLYDLSTGKRQWLGWSNGDLIFLHKDFVPVVREKLGF